MNTFLVLCVAISAVSASLPCGETERVYRVALDQQGPSCLKPLPVIQAPTIRARPIVKSPEYLPARNIGGDCAAPVQNYAPVSQCSSNVQYENAPTQYDNSYSVVSSPVGVPSVSQAVVSSSNVADRQSTYKVSLDNCGPKTRRLRPITAPTKVAKPIETAPVTLPFKVPAPKTVSNKCKCVKTIVKPQPIQQVVVVPVIRKYVQTLARPQYETINYIAEPINCPKTECYC